QAEDGIRDRNVTGVQTCALPIFTSSTGSSLSSLGESAHPAVPSTSTEAASVRMVAVGIGLRAQVCIRFLTGASQASVCRTSCRRSEERRVGKGGRWRGGAVRVDE